MRWRTRGDLRRDARPINTTFETQKRFVANASHELRTPLAQMRTEVDVTLADPEADIASTDGWPVVRTVGAANAPVDALLVLARRARQAGRAVRKMPADLMTGVTALCDPA
jgi:signal transduction histidine kinase